MPLPQCPTLQLAPLLAPGGTAHVSTAPPATHQHGPGPSPLVHGSSGEAQDEQQREEQQEQHREEQLSCLSFAGRAELRPPLELCGPDVRVPDVDRDEVRGTIGGRTAFITFWETRCVGGPGPVIGVLKHLGPDTPSGARRGPR